VHALDSRRTSLDPSSALKTKKDGGAFAANRTVQTLCVEGISEYCRIMYDVFPEDALVHAPLPPSPAPSAATQH
jgi:hypothetical protein